MPQFFGQEKLTKLNRISNTTVRLPAGSKLRLAGQGFNLSSNLDCNSTVSGAGGLDTGSIAASTFYYVYVVKNLTSVALVASTSATAPTGFSSFRKVGAFYTDSSSDVFKAYWFGEINQTVLSARVQSSGTVTSEANQDFLNGNFVYSFPQFSINYNSGFFSVIPSVVATNTNSVGRLIGVISESLASVSLRTFDDAAANNPHSFNLVVQKQGVDAIQPDWSI